jgi:hypothetical protein
VVSEAFIHRSIAFSSRDTYNSSWKHWERYCEIRQRSPWLIGGPAAGDNRTLLVGFAAYVMLVLGHRHKTLEGYYSAIAKFHIERGFAHPFDGDLYVKAAKATAKAISEPSQLRPPVTPALLSTLLTQVSLLHRNPARVAQLTAAITLCFSLMLRASEFSFDHKIRTARGTIESYAIRYSGVTFFRDSSPCEWDEEPDCVGVTIPGSKTDRGFAGVRRYLWRAPDVYEGICPVRALVKLFSFQNSAHLPEAAAALGVPMSTVPLFSNAFAGGGVSDKDLSQLLKIAAFEADLPDPGSYSSHCFRVGGATFLAETGATAIEIMSIGRWDSDYYRKYNRATPGLTSRWGEVLASMWRAPRRDPMDERPMGRAAY